MHFQQACDVTFALDFLCNFQRSLDTAPFTLSLQFYDAFDATPLTFFPISTRSWCYALNFVLAISARFPKRKGFKLKLHVIKECNLHEELFRIWGTGSFSCRPTNHWQRMALTKKWLVASACQCQLENDGHTVMSEDVKGMVYEWVWRQSLGPVYAFNFLHELQGLLKHWRKRTLQSLISLVFLGPCKVRCKFDGGRSVISMKRNGRLSSVYLLPSST